jgi:sulfoxide reductase heme-binding subunit YedZ
MKTISSSKRKAFVLGACFIPLLLLVIRFLIGRLGADPVQTLLLSTGDWTMRFILLTLLVTPLMDLTGWKRMFFLRRLFGLYSLLYAGLHFLVYLGLGYLFNIRMILREAPTTPFVIIGFGSFLLLIPLGITSMKSLMKRMRRQNWRIIHGLVYLIGIGGIVHYLLKLKIISNEFIVYTVLLALLLLYRLISWIFLKWTGITIVGRILATSGESE